MSETLPEITLQRGVSPRRRLVVAIGGTLLVGLVAAAIASEERAEHEGAEPQAPVFDLTSLAKEIRTPSPPPPRAPPIPDASTEATEALRVQVDRYLDARAAALRQLDTARGQGVDPAVISAMAAVLGTPVDAGSRSSDTPPDTSPIAPQLPEPEEPRAL